MNELIAGRGIDTTAFKITIDRDYLIKFIMDQFYDDITDLNEVSITKACELLQECLTDYCDHMDLLTKEAQDGTV